MLEFVLCRWGRFLYGWYVLGLRLARERVVRFDVWHGHNRGVGTVRKKGRVWHDARMERAPQRQQSGELLRRCSTTGAGGADQ